MEVFYLPKFINQHRELLRCSEETKKYPLIQRVIEENIKLDSTFLKTLPAEELSIIDELPNIIIRTENEWDGNPIPEIILDGEERWKCSLCGTDNKLIFYINNKHNEMRLNVGSRCILKFTDISARLGDIRAIIRQAEKERLEKIRNIKLPGVGTRLEGWKTLIDQFEIMIPSAEEKNYIDLGKQAQGLFAKALKPNAGSEITLQMFELIFAQADKELLKIGDYVENHKNDPNVIKREIVIALKDKSSIIKQLKITGTVNMLNAHLITEFNFMNAISQKVNQIPNIDYTCSVYNEKYAIRFNNYPEIPFMLSPRNFMEIFGYYIFHDKTNINKNRIIEKGIIPQNRISNIIKISKDLLKQINSEVEQNDIENNRIYIGNYSEDKFVEIPIDVYVDKCKRIIFGLQEFNPKLFEHEIYNRTQPTKKELNDIRYVYKKGRKGKYEELGRDRR